jgi:hypothetical protein
VPQKLVQIPPYDELHTDEACKEEVSIIVTDNDESILGPPACHIRMLASG